MQNNTFSVEGLFDFLNAGVSAFHSTWEMRMHTASTAIMMP